MRSLAWVLLRAGGWVRPALVVLCTAVSTALLLVALAMLLLPAVPTEPLLDVVADTGTRGGAAFGAAVLVVPVVLLLHQALRLGQAARDRRLAGLRVAGVTPREVRRLGALEVGYPAVLGGVLGVGLFALLRSVLGGGQAVAAGGTAYSVGLVPTEVAPAWWMMLLLLLVVVGGATLLGLRVGRDVQLTPQGTARRQAARRPRPWGLLVLGAAAALVVLAVRDDAALGQALLLASLALTVLGLVLLAPWVAWLIGRAAQGRVTSVGALLASRRLVHAPGAAGRAGAAIGGISMTGAVLGVLLGDVAESGPAEFSTVFSLLLVSLGLLAALVVVSLSLAVHSAETLLDDQRSMASLHALGVPASTIRASQRVEGLLVAVPMALLGGSLGTAAYLALVGVALLPLVGGLAGVVVTTALSAVAVRLAVALTGRVTRRVVDPEHLRTA